MGRTSENLMFLVFLEFLFNYKKTVISYKISNYGFFVENIGFEPTTSCLPVESISQESLILLGLLFFK